MTDKPRAACYCRISSDPKDKREGVHRQREDTAALCELKGWKVADVYVDNDRSASNGKGRPEWERLLADIEAGKIDAVAAWDQDRVNRMMEDFIAYKKLFVQRGILLATSNNGDIDLSTPSGVLTATIKTAVSEHEVAMMKIRMRRAARQRAEQGIPKWKKAFGYAPGPHGDNCPPTCSSLHHQPDPVTAPMVREGYTAILAGGSITEIARTWNTAGIYGLTGRPWSASTVSLFLRAPRNAGLRAHNDEIVLDADGNPVMGTWPALVDEALWRSVQAVLNAPGRAPGRKTVRKHLLTGVLRCGKCGDRLSGLQIGGTKQIAYNCKGCRGVSVRAEHVEPLLEAVIAGRLAKPDAVDLLRADLHDEADAEALRTERATLLSRLNDIADERADGLLTGQQAKRASDRINEKLAAIEARQQDQEKLRVFDGIPLGHPEVADAVARLSPDRLRAVMAVLFTATVMPVGKGSHVFNPQRIKVGWL